MNEADRVERAMEADPTLQDEVIEEAGRANGGYSLGRPGREPVHPLPGEPGGRRGVSHEMEEPGTNSQTNYGSADPAMEAFEPGPTHRVAEGETLRSLAERFLGSADAWEQLYALNRDKLRDPRDELQPGTVLAIPLQGEGE